MGSQTVKKENKPDSLLSLTWQRTDLHHPHRDYWMSGQFKEISEILAINQETLISHTQIKFIYTSDAQADCAGKMTY